VGNKLIEYNGEHAMKGSCKLNMVTDIETLVQNYSCKKMYLHIIAIKLLNHITPKYHFKVDTIIAKKIVAP